MLYFRCNSFHLKDPANLMLSGTDFLLHRVGHGGGGSRQCIGGRRHAPLPSPCSPRWEYPGRGLERHQYRGPLPAISVARSPSGTTCAVSSAVCGGPAGGSSVGWSVDSRCCTPGKNYSGILSRSSSCWPRSCWRSRSRSAGGSHGRMATGPGDGDGKVDMAARGAGFGLWRLFRGGVERDRALGAGLTLEETPGTRLNALKQAMAFCVNVAAAVIFLFSGQVVWPAAAGHGSWRAAGRRAGRAAGGADQRPPYCAGRWSPSG